MTPKVFINGKLFDKADAKVSVYDHGFLYGDGVFEGIRVYEAKVFKLREHIDRLYDSARHIALEIPISREQLIEAVLSTVKANDKRNGYIRLIVSRGGGTLGLDPRKTSDPQIIIIVDDISLYPPELYDNGMEIATAATIRNHPNATNPRIKSLNYLNNILAKIEATNAGVQEALMLSAHGYVAECTGDNIFIVRGGALLTPPPYAGILKGITRACVMDLARKAKVAVREEMMTRHDLYNAEECFLTGTAAEIAPIVKIDGRTIGTAKPGKVTLRLMRDFRKATRSDGVRY